MSSELVRIQGGPVTQLVKYVVTSAVSSARSLLAREPRPASVASSLLDVEQIGFVLDEAGLPRNLVVADFGDLKWLWCDTSL